MSPVSPTPYGTYNVSLLSSSTQKRLTDIRGMFQGRNVWEKPNALELYLLRECDLDDFQRTLGPVGGSNISMAHLIGRLTGRKIARLADEIRECLGMDPVDAFSCPDTRRRLHEFGPGLPVISVATYFPELTSADLDRRDDAVRALANAVRLADALGVTNVEMVAGRHDEECTRTYCGNRGSTCIRTLCQGRDCPKRKPEECGVVLSWKNYTVGRFRADAPASLPKVRWLVSGLRRVYNRVRKLGLVGNVQLLLEMEPGQLFVISRPHLVRYVLERTRDMVLPLKDRCGNDTGVHYPFINFNCDIGHCLLMTSQLENYPGTVWRTICAGLPGPEGMPAFRTGNFHVSDHPYNRVHLDRPPTTAVGVFTPYNSISVPDLEDPSAETGFIPWLNCVLCVAEHGCHLSPYGANVSLELEAEFHPEPVYEGLRSVTQALNAVNTWRQAHPDYRMKTCSDCPQSPCRGLYPVQRSTSGL